MLLWTDLIILLSFNSKESYKSSSIIRVNQFVRLDMLEWSIDFQPDIGIPAAVWYDLETVATL